MRNKNKPNNGDQDEDNDDGKPAKGDAKVNSIAELGKRDPNKLHAILTNPKPHPQVEMQPRIDEHPEQTQAKSSIMAKHKNRPSTNPMGATIDEQLDILCDRLADDWMLNEYDCSLEAYTDHNLDLLEANKEIQIGPNTSNYTLGKLKSRRDQVGHAAREELARRFKEKLNKDAAGGILHDHLTGRKQDPDKLAAAGEVLQGAAGRTISRHINAAIETHQDRQERKRVRQSIINQAQYRKRKKAAQDKQKAQQNDIDTAIGKTHEYVKKQAEKDGWSSMPWHYSISGALGGRDHLQTHFVQNHRTIIKKMKALDQLSKQLGSDHPRTQAQVGKFLNDNMIHIGRIAEMHTVPGIRHSVANLKVMSGPTAQMAKAKIQDSYMKMSRQAQHKHTQDELERLRALEQKTKADAAAAQAPAAPVARPIRRAHLTDEELGQHPAQQQAPADPFAHASHPADAARVAPLVHRIKSLFSMKKDVGPDNNSK